jgi:hypothetical protein
MQDVMKAPGAVRACEALLSAVRVSSNTQESSKSVVPGQFLLGYRIAQNLIVEPIWEAVRNG